MSRTPAAPLAHHAGEQGRLYRITERGFEAVIGWYATTLRWVLRHQPATLVVTVATLVLTIALYVVAPKGFFPVQDTGAILGISEAPEIISFSAMSERQQALGPRDPEGPRRRQPVVLHRGRRREHDAQQRPDPDQPQAAGGAAQRLRDHPAPAGVAGQGGRDHALHAAGPGSHRGRSGEPHAVPVCDPGRRPARAQRVGRRRLADRMRRCPSCRTSPATSRTRGCRPGWSSTATRRARFGITPQLIDDTLYDAFGQRQVSTIFTQLNQYHVVLEVAARVPGQSGGAQAHLRAVAAPARRCR